MQKQRNDEEQHKVKKQRKVNSNSKKKKNFFFYNSFSSHLQSSLSLTSLLTSSFSSYHDFTLFFNITLFLFTLSLHSALFLH